MEENFRYLRIYCGKVARDIVAFVLIGMVAALIVYLISTSVGTEVVTVDKEQFNHMAELYCYRYQYIHNTVDCAALAEEHGFTLYP
jgi:hypothetical protein